MGLGDWLMATADIKALHAETGRPVHVVGKGERVMWSEVFENNPKVSRGRSGTVRLVNGPGLRPYIVGRNDVRWTWRRGRDQQPGELYLTPAEKAFAAPYAGKVLIEPNVKANGHANKAWAFERWQAVVREYGAPMLQVGQPGTRWLEGVQRVTTPAFRLACAVLAVSRGFVGTEGALHHAAAALGVPAVVLWSEFIAPDVTGYTTQRNIRHAGEPCGARVPCASCAASMAAIGVDEVHDAVARMVQ
jgi:hypothetical protein